MRRRALQLVGPALILIGAIWAAVAMADTTVEYTGPRGQSHTADVADINPDVNNVRYREGGHYLTITGVSIDKLLASQGVSSWTSVTVEGLTVTSDSFRPKKPPVFYINPHDDKEVIFFKPKNEAGPADNRPAGGGNLDMSYQVPLEYDASDDTPKAGQTVTYTVTVPGGGSQNDYEFSWSSNTAGSGTGRMFDVTYPDSGGEVTVNVTAKRDGTTVATRTITSEKLDPAPQDNSGTGGTGGYGSGYGSGYGTGGYTPTTPSFPSTQPNFPNYPTDPGTVKPGKSPVPPPDTGTSVTGELLSLDTPAPSTPGQPAPAPETTATAPNTITSNEPDPVTAPGAVIGAGIVFTLFGLGAGREFETFSPRRLIRRPNLSGLRRLSLPRWK